MCWSRAFLPFLAIALLSPGCKKQKLVIADAPRTTPDVRLQDVSFKSVSLQREMQYRVILPAKVSKGEVLPVIYLLHGGGGGFRDWSNYSDVAKYAAQGFLLVMPEGGSAYYTNAADRPQDRYEDYIVHDLLSDVESRFPVSRSRAQRAIVGISMGGFGAVKIGLKYPELFSFAGGISPALDVPSRPFSIKRIQQWRAHRSIFGEWQGAVQKQNDPYVLVTTSNPETVPYLYLSCGDKEGLLPANRKFANLLTQYRFRYEFHVISGGHDWNQWNAVLPLWFGVLQQHMSSTTR